MVLVFIIFYFYCELLFITIVIWGKAIIIYEGSPKVLINEQFNNKNCQKVKK